MLHYMVSQLTRFNLHIRVKGRRNVQGSEQIKKFLISNRNICCCKICPLPKIFFSHPPTPRDFYSTIRPGPARHGTARTRPAQA